MKTAIKSIRTRRLAADAGFSLVELLVAMIVFSIFMAVLAASIVGISNASSRAQVTARSSSRILAVFQDFDHQVRYADSINFPGVGTGGAQYIEYRIPAASSATGVAMCSQWRYTASTLKLEYRQWQEGSATFSTWATKLSNVEDLGANYPFQLTAADDTVVGKSNQKLAVTIQAGSTAYANDAKISTSIIARNSGTGSPSNVQAPAGVSKNPVCASSGYRST